MTDKPSLRTAFRAHRDALTPTEREEAARAVAEHLSVFLDDAPVGAYWPIGSELSPLPVLLTRVRRGLSCALPCVEAGTLVFRQWRAGDALDRGPHGTSHPAATAPLLAPATVLTPLLAFDTRGYRLGYGGGYYDRFLAAGTRAIGLAYAWQETDALPREPHDVPLAGVATPDGVRLFS